MAIHLLVKFQYFAWNSESSELLTLDEHQKIINKFGSCYWGRTTTISEEKLSLLNSQISESVPVKIFLYCIQVPQSIHKDKVLWFVADLVKAIPGNPVDSQKIPEYYRDKVDLGVTFEIKNIKPLKYVTGSTPKVPGQAAIRYCEIKGDIKPENLYIPNSSDKLCSNYSPNEALKEFNTLDEKKHLTNADQKITDELIYAQSKIIELQDEVLNLREYKDKYQRIIGLDHFFNSEKLLEDWVEENIHLVSPELSIIDRQPNVSWPDGKFGRMDLLAINKETKSLCVIEIKTRKRKLASSYDQFLRYTSWIKRNKQQIIDRYKNLEIIVTDNPQFYIITDHVTDEMKAICSDHEIKLIKIFGGLGVEKVI